MAFVSRHQAPRTPKLNTFGDFLYYAYANMQMLIMALNTGRRCFDQTCYMVRAKAFKAYREGRWKIHDLHINNVWKMLDDNDSCWYCGKEMDKSKLTIEHIFPRSKNGSDDMDNIVLVCPECNSSKRDLDLLEWYSTRRKHWPWPYIFAYYLKHVYLYAVENDLLGKSAEEIDAMDLPFKYQYIPLNYPNDYLEAIWRIKDENVVPKDITADNPEAYNSKTQPI